MSKYNHILISITGLALTGEQEIQHLSEAGFRTSDWAKSCLNSKEKEGYDKCHRLEDGREYQLVIVPGKEVVKQNRTTAELRKYTTGFGYAQPLAGIIPRIRETISDKMMEKMGFRYIAAIHEPITDSCGYPRVLQVTWRSGGRWVGAYWDCPGYRWDDLGAFAFVVPAS